MGSNLPPGVTPGMIPGNRPEDEWWDTFAEKLGDGVDERAEWVLEHDPETIARVVTEYLDGMGSVVAKAYDMGVGQGRQDEMERAAERVAYEEADGDGG